MKWLLFDIEGTIASISFVKDVLFPYSSKKMDEYVRNISIDDKKTLSEHISDQNEKVLSDHEISQKLKQWIAEDKKDTYLKSVQGKIWKEGFEKKELLAPLYDEVAPFFEECKEKGYKLGIYSSGSIQAQKLFLTYNEKGNVTKFLDAYFDTTIGSKKEASSYTEIAKSLDVKSEEITFFTDCTDEYKASTKAGINTYLVSRDSLDNIAVVGEDRLITSFVGFEVE